MNVAKRLNGEIQMRGEHPQIFRTIILRIIEEWLMWTATSKNQGGGYANAPVLTKCEGNWYRVEVENKVKVEVGGRE
jgi:hypothetical protein